MANIDSIINIVSSSIKNSCTNDASVSMFANQLEVFSKYVEGLCIPETSLDEELEKLKIEIYNFYKETLSPIINKYEVFFHNFPENATDTLSEVVLDLSKVFDNNITYNDKKYYLDKVQRVNFVLYYTVGIELAKYYMKQAKAYKNALKKFNYMAVQYYKTDKLYKNEIKAEEKSIEKLYKEVREQYKSFFKEKNKDGSLDYDLDKIVLTRIGDNEIVYLLIEKLEKIIKDFEYHYPKIVDCGYNAPWLRKILSLTIFVLLPLVLAAITVWRWLA